jgi:ferric-dicitrate binding protein FerR (iron transport regulator)
MNVRRHIDMKKDKDFLNDEKFLLWRLTRDSELEAYWHGFVSANPAVKEEFEKAISKFSRLRLNKIRPDAGDTEHLLQRIKATLSLRTRRHAVQVFVRYVAAACIIFMAALYIYNNVYKSKDQPDSTYTIVCENLEAEDIHLIINRETKTFAKDVQISIDEDGKTTIHEADNESAIVVKTEKTAKQTLVVPYGKRSQLELSDGTKVWLNSGSVLEFPATFTGKFREVRLVGEIYLEVAEDIRKPFLVHTDDFDVQVYGTKFDISAYRDAGMHRVVLVEGKVSVKSASRDETFLRPNDMLTCTQDEWNTSVVDVTEYLSWKNGYILLDDTPMEEMLRQLERYYNLSFRVSDDVDLAGKTCSGKIILVENTYEVMETVALLMSAKYERDGKTIFIKCE